MASGDTKTNQYLDIAANGTRADLPTDTCCETRTQSLIRGVAERVIGVEEEVERLENNPDVVDIVATYQDLQDYDTSELTDKDIIRVLQDETHDGESTYYRYNKQSDTWTYIGESKQYDDFVGTDGTTAGEAGLVPAPATTDVGKFLKADGTWDTAGSAINIVQTNGTSTTDVMSQKAVTDLLFNNNNKNMIQIGTSASSTGGSYYQSVAIGRSAQATARDATAIGSIQTTATARAALSVGTGANTSAQYATALGAEAQAKYQGSVALGAYSNTSVAGSVHIGSTDASYGYNNSNYRLLTGLYDPQNAHDAATKGYVDANAGGGPVTFYSTASLNSTAVNVSLYSDKACTNVIQTADFFQAIRSGKTVFLQSGGSGDYDSRVVVQIVYAVITNVDTSDAYDEVGPYAQYFYGNVPKQIYPVEIDPASTSGFTIS